MSFEQAASLAGFLTAHGVWCVCEGETLVPMATFEKAGKRQMIRFVAERLEQGAAQARTAVLDNAHGGERAVSVVDGYFTHEGHKYDALIVHAVDYFPRMRSLDIVLPYRPKTEGQPFAVHKPKFVDYAGFDFKAEFVPVAQAFFQGVDSHEEAAKVWNAHLDQSV
jgi:hypothetical protein